MVAPSDSAEGNLNPPTPTTRFDRIPDEDLKVFISSKDNDTDNTKKQVKYFLFDLQEFCFVLNGSLSHINNAAQRSVTRYLDYRVKDKRHTALLARARQNENENYRHKKVKVTESFHILMRDIKQIYHSFFSRH